ncbi:unnamed protein product [Sphagnum troendelagicum]|uniref:eRF1/Pelota-like N-terminal domain-containing protein n=1 Tax=Sphagnum troendelagicum TaxID=128251 RepID=A0ABP0TLN0_9BRYO
MADGGGDTDKNIEIWKIKKLIKALESARGNGTSMISLIMPPRDQVSQVTKMLGDEFGTASNIKNRVNRQSVLGAITSAQLRLKLHNKVPPNGLVLYTGMAKKKSLMDGILEPWLCISLMLSYVSYGGENGFNQAIELSAEILANVKFIQEKRLIGKYFEEISQDTGKYVFGIEDTLKALEMGAVETLIVWENLEVNRYVLKNAVSGELVIKHLNREQESDQSTFREAETQAELEVQEKLSLLEWFANVYKGFGCTLEFVTNKSQVHINDTSWW